MRGDFLAGEAPFGNDDTSYVGIADSIARGDGTTLPIVDPEHPGAKALVVHYPPGWPLLGVPLIRLGVPAWISLPILNWILYGLVAAWTIAVALRVAGYPYGLIAAPILLFSHLLWTMATRGMSEFAFTICLLLAVQLYPRDPSRGWRYALLSGLLLGYLTAIRYIGVLVLPLPAVLALVHSGMRPTRREVGLAAVSMASALMIAMPVLLRRALLGAEIAGERGETMNAAYFHDVATLGWQFLTAYGALSLETAARSHIPAVVDQFLGFALLGGILGLGIIVPWRWYRSSQPERRLVADLGAASALYLAGMILLRLKVPFDIYNFRFMIPVLPFLALVLAAALARHPAARRKILVPAFLLVICLTMVSASRLLAGVSHTNKWQPFEAGRWVRTHLAPDERFLVESGYSRLIPYVQGRGLVSLPEPVANEDVEDLRATLMRRAQELHARHVVFFPIRTGSGESGSSYRTLPSGAWIEWMRAERWPVLADEPDLIVFELKKEEEAAATKASP